MIYLDTAASSDGCDTRVIEAMECCGGFGNPSSIHKAGRHSRGLITNARKQVAKLLNCDESQVVFTSGGSESNAMVLRGFKPLYSDANAKVAYSAVEHESVIENAKRFPKGHWGDPVEIPVTELGTVNIDALCKMLEADVDIQLVSVMAANNEIPSVNVISEIAQVCHEHGVFLHSDCVQAVGAVDLDVSKLGADFVTLSAHKFDGPHGVGVLYSRYNNALFPLVSGSGSQEFGLKAGTENVRGIVGAGKAAEIAFQEASTDLDRITRIKCTFYSDLCKHLANKEIAEIVHSNGLPVEYRNKILSLTFDGVDGQSLVLALSAKDIFISAGSACNANSSTGSKVLRSIGLTEEQAHSTVRISFSKYTTERDATVAAKVIADTVYDLRNAGAQDVPV